jgi:hypothetical protein
MNGLKECRICFDNDKNYEYISPCLCSGTSKNVHISCLEKWREINIYKPAYDKCMECHFEYKIKKEFPDEDFYLNCENRKISSIIYTGTIAIALISNVFHDKDFFILTILDFGHTDKTSKYCYPSWKNETYCEPTSLYGILNSSDWFTVLFFYLNFYISLNLILLNFYYRYKIHKHIRRINEFKKKSLKHYCYWLLNVFKFYIMYYISIYIFKYPELMIGYTYLSNIIESVMVKGFTSLHNNVLYDLNYDNPQCILPYESSDDENYVYNPIEEEEPINI